VPMRPAPTTAQAGGSVGGGSSSRIEIPAQELRIPAEIAATRRTSAELLASVTDMASAADRREELKAVYQQASACTRCPQLASTRMTVVFGSGNANADLMLVGEAPGANEDKQGVPFVGQAGRLLEQLLGEIGLTRQDVFIANLLKCRPPGNRDPLPQEIESCQGYLYRQLDLIEPLVVCTLGNFSTKLLRGDPLGITRLHGRSEVRRIGPRTVRLYPLFHPAAALYTPSMLATLREDFSRIPELLALPAPEQPEPAPDPEPELVPVAAEPEPQAEAEPETPQVEQLGLF
jgi:uracil-DNA glycosylase family 4